MNSQHIIPIQSILEQFVSKLSSEVYSVDSSLADEERKELREQLIQEIARSMGLSFSFKTHSMPHPLKPAFIMRRVEELLKPLLSQVLFIDIRLAIEEITGNIIEHSFINRHEADVHYHFTLDVQKITIIIEDTGERGRTYNFQKAGRYGSLDELRQSAVTHLGGMGVYLVRQVMDEVNYISEPGKFNRITMTKYYDEDISQYYKKMQQISEH